MQPMLAGLMLAVSLGASVVGQPITFRGIGPLRVGHSLADAARAAREELVEAHDVPSGSEACYHVRLASAPSVLLMVEGNRIVRVETGDPQYRTLSGVHVGDSEATVRRVYGRRLEITDHKYDDAGHYFIVRSQDRRYALVMESDGKQVVYIRAGLAPAAEYVEGCS